jgi:hypothetical protein
MEEVTIQLAVARGRLLVAGCQSSAEAWNWLLTTNAWKLMADN